MYKPIPACMVIQSVIEQLINLAQITLLFFYIWLPCMALKIGNYNLKHLSCKEVLGLSVVFIVEYHLQVYYVACMQECT